MGVEPRHINLTPETLQEELKTLETRYHMKSDVFYAKYTRGELGDAEDFVFWAGLFDIAAAQRVRVQRPVMA